MLRILHLSDLHYGLLLPDQQKPGRSPSAHRFARDGVPLPEAMAGILIRDIEQPPDVVVISGDIGWSGARGDYVYARQFIEVLRAGWKETPLVIAPGNHDVDCARTDRKQEDFITFLRGVHADGFVKQYPLLRPEGFSERKRLVALQRVTSKTGDEEVLVVAVNSAADIETTKGTPVFITPDVLQALEDTIRDMKVSERVLRIFVLHHHLFPFAERDWDNVTDPMAVKDRQDSTLLWNSAKLQGWLARNAFHVVLHGHKHLSHGREDVLWSHSDETAEGRRIFVVGAGSAGVEDGHREHGEPLSYNMLSAMRLSEGRWSVDVRVRHIEERGVTPVVKALHTYKSTVGKPATASPLLFQAELMHDCHRAIRDACESKGTIGNFISVVEDPKYIHPETVRIGAEHVDKGAVQSSFKVLHPEYHENLGWTDISAVDEALQNISPRFRFQHGPRLFGHPERRSVVRPGEAAMEARPILRAVKSLALDATSKAYVSLFNPEIDVLSQDEPLPGLMSIQFIKQQHFLDVVATFRKIELSFWWVVNMYELGMLLNWAAKANTRKFTPRRITFFAALAEWKFDPEPAFVTRLDGMKLGTLLALVLRAHEVGAEAQGRRELIELLIEKKKHTNDTNLDATGLENLRGLIDGVRSVKDAAAGLSLPSELAQSIEDAIGYIRKAMKENLGARQSQVSRAIDALEKSILILSR